MMSACSWAMMDVVSSWVLGRRPTAPINALCSDWASANATVIERLA